jgi:hypothetical protein
MSVSGELLSSFNNIGVLLTSFRTSSQSFVLDSCPGDIVIRMLTPRLTASRSSGSLSDRINTSARVSLNRHSAVYFVASSMSWDTENTRYMHDQFCLKLYFFKQNFTDDNI